MMRAASQLQGSFCARQAHGCCAVGTSLQFSGAFLPLATTGLWRCQAGLLLQIGGTECGEMMLQCREQGQLQAPAHPRQSALHHGADAAASAVQLGLVCVARVLWSR